MKNNHSYTVVHKSAFAVCELKCIINTK